MNINDNRSYSYYENYQEYRPEYDLVSSFVPSGCSVLDLGCGEGSLMQLLIKNKNCICSGIELVQSGVDRCKEKGLDVMQGKIDKELPLKDNSVEVVVCNVTLQMVGYPEITVQEMKRISRHKLILSFPNFAYWLNRLEMLIKGRMPRKLLFGYKWYNTGHIHQFSLSDLLSLISELGGLKIVQIVSVASEYKLLNVLAKWMPNLFGKIIIVEINKI